MRGEIFNIERLIFIYLIIIYFNKKQYQLETTMMPL